VRTLAVRWLVTFAREQREKGMPEKLANEILDAEPARGVQAKGRRLPDGAGEYLRALSVVDGRGRKT
jgi:small subunit ribosomal protein S7